MSRQWVILDDSDPKIQYSGQWLSATPDSNINGLGNFGVPFKNSLHAINANGSFSFAFNGSAISIYGTTNIERTAGVDDPAYECIVDGVSIAINTPIIFPENNWRLCSSESLPTDKEHNITVRVTAQKRTFYLDRVMYIPSDNAEFNASSWLLFEANHPSVSFDSGWKDFREIGNYTTTNGASVSISYFGRSLIFLGAVPSDFPVSATTAQYTVDDGKSTPFRLAGLPSSKSTEQYNQAFFQTPVLPQGQHTVKVTHGGSSSTTPLILGYYMVQRDPLTPSSGAGANQNHTNIAGGNGNADNSHEKSRIGVVGVVGGVVGGIVLMGLLIGIAIWVRRSMHKKRRKAQYLALDIDDTIGGPTDPFVDNEWDPSTGLHRPSISTASTTSFPMVATSTVTSGSSRLGGTNSSGSSSGTRSDARRTVYSVTNVDSASTPSSSLHYSPLYPAEKKGKTLAVTERAAPEAASSSTSESKPSSSVPYSPIVVRHEDSGVRLPQDDHPEREVIDLPPTYTPG